MLHHKHHRKAKERCGHQGGRKRPWTRARGWMSQTPVQLRSLSTQTPTNQAVNGFCRAELELLGLVVVFLQTLQKLVEKAGKHVKKTRRVTVTLEILVKI